nr:hypothetical protein [Pseudenhygromyxa sp. WMMC2535]
MDIAWKVIRYCGRGCNHPFLYPLDFEISTSDDYGNYSPRIPAKDGQHFTVLSTPIGGRMLRRGPAANSSVRDIEVTNGLPRGAINVNIFRGGKILARKTAVVPGQKAVFQFQPTIWVGVVSQVREGQSLNSAVISDVNTEFSLLGIASADIVMTGGGCGTSAKRYEFELENIVPF